MSLAVSSVALMATGAASGAVGAYWLAKGQKNALGFQADMAQVNANLAEQSAQGSLLAGQRQEQGIRLRGAAIKGAQRAGLAANGIDLAGSPTAQNILSTTDYMTEVDANTAAANAVRAAWGYRTQGMNYRNEAAFKRATAEGIDPTMAGVSSLIGSAGKVASTWYSLDKAGAFEPSDIDKANQTEDPIYSLGKSRGWWSNK